MRNLHATTKKLPPLSATREKSMQQQRYFTGKNNYNVLKKISWIENESRILYSTKLSLKRITITNIQNLRKYCCFLRNLLDNTLQHISDNHKMIWEALIL